MSIQSAHKGIIKAIRQKLAHWLHEPLQETPWRAARYWGYPDPFAPPAPLMLVRDPAPATPVSPPAAQPTGTTHLQLIDGIAGGQPWPGPAGTWSAVYTHHQPHRRRETGSLVPMPATLLPEPRQPGRTATEDLFLLDAVDMQPDLDEDPDATIEHPRTRANKLFRQALAGLRESEKHDVNN